MEPEPINQIYIDLYPLSKHKHLPLTNTGTNVYDEHPISNIAA